MTTLNHIGAAALAFSVSGTAVSAASINIARQNPGDTFGGDGNAPLTYTLPSFGDRTSLAGPFALTGDSGLGDFLAWCIEIGVALLPNDPGAYHVDPTAVSAAARTDLGKLVDTAFAGHNFSSDVEMAKYQTAIWEIVYDSDEMSGATLASGDYVITESNDGAKAAAESFLNGLNGPKTGRYRLTYLQSDDSQNLLTATPVPLPAAGWMLIAGLGGLAALRRRAARA